MATKMEQYRGSAAQWATANPTLDDGELGCELDTQILRVGDGTTPWNTLAVPPYIPRSVLTTPGDLVVGTGPGTATRLAAPAPGSNKKLTVQADGSLAWVDGVDLSSLEMITHAADTYETIASETAADATFESSAHASGTYISNASAATQHALYDTLDHMDATYVSKARATSSYEPKWKYVIKPTNTTRISTTTLTVDPDLVFPVVAGGTYFFEMGLFLDDISTTADFQFGMTPGLSTNWHAGLHGASTSATTVDTTLNHRMMGTGANELTSLSIAGLGAFFYVSIKGVCAITTAGNFGVTWAQFTSAASPGTIIYKGSYLKALRIS